MFFRSKLLLLFTALGAAFITLSCTKDIDVKIPDSAVQIVVEGTIENGTPPFILLTRSSKFFDRTNTAEIGSFFVNNAEVKVFSPADSITLVEFCLNNLPLSDEQKVVVLSSLGFEVTDTLIPILPNICFYTVPDIVSYFLSGTSVFLGKEQTTYRLQISAEGKQLTSSTFIPKALGLDSLSYRPHPNMGAADSLVAVYAHFTVPDTFGNFIRYWTKRNSEPFYLPRSASVYDDRLFVGLSVGVPLERGQAPRSRIDWRTYTYFWRGDTATVKWSNIDSKTYDFFFTLENDGGSSPFSSPVRVKTNINGGLGVWAGYASSFHTIIVPK